MKSILSRREFLKSTALAAAALSLPSLDALALGQGKLERKGAPKRIIIVGAGLSGLSAAYELSQLGHDVTILEAQMRPGGRVQTLREPFSDGLYAEAGAARIPESHTYTLKYAKLFELKLDPFYPSKLDSVGYMRGTRLVIKQNTPPDLSRLPLKLTPEEMKAGVWGLWTKYVGPKMLESLGSVNDVASLNWPPPPLKKFDDVTYVDFLRAQGASPDAIALMMLGFANPEDDRISALESLREVALNQGKLVKIRGGTDLLPRAFAQRLAAQIRYHSPVARIEQDTQSVRAFYTDASGANQTMTADYLLCTIPFSVLRRMEVSPKFSPEKQRTIEQMSYLPVTRIFLQSRKRFWESAGLNGFGLSDMPEEVWHPTWDQPGARGLLMSYLRGSAAHRVAKMEETDRIRFMLEHMEKIHPGIRENFEGGVSKAWEEDEWARGAFTHLEPGQMFGLMPHVARAEGRIHFAGEHASAWHGWMQGALESGNRAAREINER
jgi:monoamine oxidase